MTCHLCMETFGTHHHHRGAEVTGTLNEADPGLMVQTPGPDSSTVPKLAMARLGLVTSQTRIPPTLCPLPQLSNVFAECLSDLFLKPLGV